MRTRAFSPTLITVLAVVAAAPAAAPAAAQDPAQPQPPTFPRLGQGVPVGDGAVEPCTIADVSGDVRCGVFRVDEDSAPGGRTLDLHFVILDALDPASATLDPVVFFMGGPGAATIPAARGLARNLRDVRRTRDLLLVDLRGIGLSAPLDCDVGYPRGLESRFGTLFPLDHIERCRDALSERADLEQYTTATSVDDIEALRRWLGYSQVNLYGGSYGTVVSQIYMRRHPEAVRTAVLNAVAPLGRPGYVQMARGLQDALDHLVAECESQPDCAQSFPGFRSELTALLDRFADGPVEVTVDGRTVPFSSGDLGYALRGLLYGRAAELPFMIHEAAEGRLHPMVRYYLARTGWIGNPGGGSGNHLSVICAEDIERVSDEDVARASAGTFLGDHVIRSYRDACDVWPNADLPPSYFAPVESDTPTLLLSGGRDPVTPVAGADEVAANFSRSLHVVVPNAGHGVGGPCIIGMVVRLVEDGSLERVDSGCVGAQPATVFRTR